VVLEAVAQEEVFQTQDWLYKVLMDEVVEVAVTEAVSLTILDSRLLVVATEL
jgi:hypothetical protein